MQRHELQGQYAGAPRRKDTLNAEDGDAEDSLDGGPGHDKCFGDGDPGDNEDQYISCEEINGA
jgi:hypothetical protein